MSISNELNRSISLVRCLLMWVVNMIDWRGPEGSNTSDIKLDKARTKYSALSKGIFPVGGEPKEKIRKGRTPYKCRQQEKKNAPSRWMIYLASFLFSFFFAFFFRLSEIKKITRFERLRVLLELVFGRFDFFEIEDFRFRLIIVRPFKIESRIDKLLLIVEIYWIEIQIFRIKFDRLKKMIIVEIRCGNVIFDFSKIDSNETTRQIIRQFVSKKWWFRLTCQTKRIIDDWIKFRKFEISNHSYFRYFFRRFWSRLNEFFKRCRFKNSRFDKMMFENV